MPLSVVSVINFLQSIRKQRQMTETTIMKASSQLFGRKKDEKFETLGQLRDHLTRRSSGVFEKTVDLSEFGYNHNGKLFLEQGNILSEKAGLRHDLNDWSFRQLCKQVSAPAEFILNLSPRLGAECMQEASFNRAADSRKGKSVFYMDKNGPEGSEGTIRAVTTDRYVRVYDSEVLTEIEKHAGGMEAQGLYSGERDIFCFMTNEDLKVNIAGEDLSRGFMVWNSEVGSRTFGVMSFYFRTICSNHIVWGCSNVKERISKHIGQVRDIFNDLPNFIEWAACKDELINDEKAIKKAQEMMLAKDPVACAQILRKMGWGKKASEAIVQEAEVDHERFNTPGEPYSIWGIVQGATAYSQRHDNLDDRFAEDLKISKLLDKAAKASLQEA